MSNENECSCAAKVRAQQELLEELCLQQVATLRRRIVQSFIAAGKLPGRIDLEDAVVEELDIAADQAGRIMLLMLKAQKPHESVPESETALAMKDHFVKRVTEDTKKAKQASNGVLNKVAPSWVKEMTDDFVSVMRGDTTSSMARIIGSSGFLPEGVDRDDPRVKEILEKTKEAYENNK